MVTNQVELLEKCVELLKEGIPVGQKCLIPIINKQPKCSDTWEFEK